MAVYDQATRKGDWYLDYLLAVELYIRAANQFCEIVGLKDKPRQNFVRTAGPVRTRRVFLQSCNVSEIAANTIHLDPWAPRLMYAVGLAAMTDDLNTPTLKEKECKDIKRMLVYAVAYDTTAATAEAPASYEGKFRKFAELLGPFANAELPYNGRTEKEIQQEAMRDAGQPAGAEEEEEEEGEQQPQRAEPVAKRQKREIAQLKQRVAEKTRLIAEKTRLIAERDARIAERDARIAELERLVPNLNDAAQCSGSSTFNPTEDGCNWMMVGVVGAVVEH
ncbi:hypothetical protein OEZ85_012257 [Tetradesmus obliquus]|uniref:Uncharacterized protein n=1 Tax=Tetradesmus obliquus TaxID=3088 RepID=A0ABY8TV75_TETOB|nr:hypothetical protein OEZ85_012257 [Tetradesmus obliquus]